MKEGQEQGLGIDWESDAGKPVEFVNHVAVAFDGNAYTLRFYRAIPPGPDADLQTLKSVPGQHVVTLALGPASMRAIVDILQNTLQRQEE